ncbi:MAG TPA: flagellar hook-associated protein FlgL [Ideonella sp.]|uniref:flagellar hook-associated protein FlgL n=1 Tax=Ideonella sp. TaxID=1929293 RepID=UPI002B54B764|nr:flagellar hook-associated protein FlgL [Ideonella sp.]HSI50016.1 flagellar hook-associated protein FlgL [Ideonella sp.]
MTRITTAYAFSSSVENLQQRQAELVRAQEQMTSGKRVLKASDDPTAAARAERARAMEQRADATTRAIDASRNSMTLTESALSDAGELVQQARELIVAAGNASYSDAERADTANQIAAIRKQLLAVANRGDGTGGYVFSGQGSSQAPFIDQPGGVGYTGSGGATQVASDEQLPLTLDGNQTWLAAPTGNGVFTTSSNSASAWIDAGRVTSPAAITGSSYQIQFTVANGATTYSVIKDGGTAVLSDQPYTSGQAIQVDGMALSVSGTPGQGDSFDIAPSTPDASIFSVLDKAVAELKTPSRSAAQTTQTVQSSLRDIDSVANHLQSTRSMTGELLKRIDSVQGRVDDLKLFSKTTESNAEDLDMAQAISDFSNKQTGYSAALQTYASMQKLSLFNYING